MMALRSSTTIATIAVTLAGCGGGGADGAASPAVANNAAINSADTAVDKSAAQAESAIHEVVPRHASFEGKTYSQWVVSFWHGST
jgi:hypothetical protein